MQEHKNYDTSVNLADMRIRLGHLFDSEGCHDQ